MSWRTICHKMALSQEGRSHRESRGLCGVPRWNKGLQAFLAAAVWIGTAEAGFAVESLHSILQPPVPAEASAEATAAPAESAATSAANYGDASVAQAETETSCPVCQKPKKPGEKPDRKTCCHGCEVNWSKQPASISPMPKLGFAATPPAGAGYYTLKNELHGKCDEKRPPNGYAPFGFQPYSSFDADFRYVEKIDVCKRDIVESLKRVQLNDCLLFSTGGQVWTRYMQEHNSRLTELDNSYLLARTRVWGDLMVGDVARVFGEYLWADSFAEELAPLPIDVNRGDILNLFVDVNLFEYEEHPVFVRIGRQELLFGSQRLVSTLDWANTRRTFDGVRVFRRGESWDFDAFFAQVVPPNPTELDRSDENQDFTGTWLTYRPEKGHFVDFYFLNLDNRNTVTQQNIQRAPTQVSSFGTRYTGDRNGWLWDYELVLQTGEQGAADLFAGAATVGGGRHWKDACWSPTFWMYYDFASGDADPTGGDSSTFNQLYPFGHYYLGWIDQVGRQNIHDVSFQYTAYPAHWMTCVCQYHQFWLNQSRDALYNAAGVATRRDPTGAAGHNVGSEIDLLVNVHLAKYSDLLFGYSHLFGGSFLERTASANQAADSGLFYAMFQQKW